MPQKPDQPRKRLAKTWLIGGGAAFGLLLIGVVAFVAWRSVTESRQQARAREAVETALQQWCSDEPLDQVRDTKAGDFFDEFFSRTSTAPRPTEYHISSFDRVKDRTYEVAATLSFPGGREMRVYLVEFGKKSGKCSITTKASEDVSGTESHARSVLQAWLDCWVAGEDMAAFKKKHPEASARMTADVAWASLSSAGKKLVRYEITNATSAPGGGYRFTVAATVEDRGTPETKILRYAVYKDRTLSGGRWCVMGS